MDDGLHIRDIVLTTIKKKENWFLQISEALKFPNGTASGSFITIEWSKVSKFVDRLDQVLLQPLPPAAEAKGDSSDTLASRRFTDTFETYFYFIDVVKREHGKGWIRMVHITQETPRPTMDMVGSIMFPWHMMNDFVERVRQFKSGGK